VKLLEDAEWQGMRHFDAHAYRTESVDGVWEFARGCMRTYLILKEKAALFATDPDIAEALLEAHVDGLAERIFPDGYSSEAVARLRSEQIDVDALAARGWGHERLDQLVTELLLGIR
jgi:xylose isomerase